LFDLSLLKFKKELANALKMHNERIITIIFDFLLFMFFTILIFFKIDIKVHNRTKYLIFYNNVKYPIIIIAFKDDSSKESS
ncbi:MAG: hypothetical protein KGD73_09625, partial [Candidatus Lokiarchaeota archaeon]|nr:hypothetical protein [Candidatus Lokiarchaeota archaeon]